MAQSTQGHTVTIKILLNDLGDPLRYEIDQVTLAEGKMPESEELAAQPHFDCLQCQSRYFISPTIVKMDTQVAEIKEEPELDLFDVEKVEEIKSEEIKEEDFDDKDIVEIELISDSADINPNVNELSIKTEPLEEEEEASSPVKDQFTCSICSTIVRTKCNLIKHKRIMHEKELRKCMVCSWSRICTNAEFKYHLRHDHPKLPRTDFCPEVGVFNGVDFPCIYCEVQKVFTSFDDLKQHLKISHNKYYTCETCPKAYTAKSHLENHFKLVHEKQTLIVSKCDEPVKDKRAIKRTTKVLRHDHPKLPKNDFHPEEDFNGVDYPCIYCEVQMVFTSYDELKDHLRSSHKKLYMCETCPKAYTARLHLEKHFKLIHEKKRSDQIETLASSESSKNVRTKFNHSKNKSLLHQKELRKCEVCSWTRECTKAEYHAHLRRRHSKLRTEKYPEVKNFNGVDFPCVYCKVQKMFKSFDELRLHLRAHRKLYLCEICPKGYTARLHLDAHIKLVHEMQTVIVPKFDEPVKGKSDILIRLCSDGLHVNSDEVKEKEALEMSELSAKNEESPKVLNENRFQIDHCNLKPVVPLVRIDSMVTMIGFHKKKINTNEKPFICGICDAKFRWKNNLAVHMKIHLNIRYTCDECPKSYSSNPHLREHKRVVHQGKPSRPLFKCDICPAAFKKKCNLMYHIANTHLGERYTCEECSKIFTLKHILNQHKKNYHQRTQLLSCEVCPWSQTCTRAELHSHIRRNHPEATTKGFHPIAEDFNGVDYPCIYCEQKIVFTSFEMLKDHLRSVHDRRFACTICPNARAQVTNLKRHIESAHKKKNPK